MSIYDSLTSYIKFAYSLRYVKTPVLHANQPWHFHFCIHYATLKSRFFPLIVDSMCSKIFPVGKTYFGRALLYSKANRKSQSCFPLQKLQQIRGIHFSKWRVI